ncbi:MAG: hypothetical protein MJY75_00780 [Bacteroidaceae bacterium]|nr:hypothetical protein [Bacteroidaceae bacterium]
MDENLTSSLSTSLVFDDMMRKALRTVSYGQPSEGVLDFILGVAHGTLFRQLDH